MKSFSLLSLLLLSIASVQAFNLTPPTKAVFDPLSLADVDSTVKVAQVAATSTLAAGLLPLAAVAEDLVDDYEYGAVNAPISMAWIGGVFLILTSLLPLLLQGGEEAFEEMKANDADSWGKSNNALDRNRRR